MAQRAPKNSQGQDPVKSKNNSRQESGDWDYYYDGRSSQRSDYYDGYEEEPRRRTARPETAAARSPQQKSRPAAAAGRPAQGNRSDASRRSGQGSRPSDSRRPAPSGRSYQKPRRKKKHTGGIIAAVIIIIVLAAGAFAVWKSGILNKVEEVVEDVRPLPAAPEVVKTATVGATGDILLHTPVLEANATGDGYDFSYDFANVASVYEQADLMFANLEVTLAGEDYGYSSYPVFNSPDAIVPALRDAGVDVCLTANNHAYDTGDYGMARTLEVLDEYGVGHLGSRESTDEHFLMTKNINGIRLGMLCYTYDTREYTDGDLSLNFNVMTDEGSQLINTFNYENLDEFYADVQQQLDYMDMLNVDANIIFIHWGTEYQDTPNEYQTEIAQQLCDMGVDVIIGGHPHVIQEFDTYTSEDGHEMICLYSMGNELSNQRAELMDEDANRGYTEDGLVFQVTFEKFNNGNVKVGAVNIIPTWVQLDNNGYQIIALDGTQDPWSWGSSDTYLAIDSYNRTMGRIGDAYIQFRAKKNQSEITDYIEY